MHKTFGEIEDKSNNFQVNGFNKCDFPCFNIPYSTKKLLNFPYCPVIEYYKILVQKYFILLLSS